jgi:hypothetical protein
MLADLVVVEEILSKIPENLAAWEEYKDDRSFVWSLEESRADSVGSEKRGSLASRTISTLKFPLSQFKYEPICDLGSDTSNDLQLKQTPLVP